MLNLTWEKRQITRYHKQKHPSHLWAGRQALFEVGIWDSTAAHICLTGNNMTKTHLESRLITSADAEGVTWHISHRWPLYDQDFNLGVTLKQNTGWAPFLPGFFFFFLKRKTPDNHFALPLKCNLISNRGLVFNCRNWIKNIFREVLVCG